jgi:hypothetical protein
MPRSKISSRRISAKTISKHDNRYLNRSIHIHKLVQLYNFTYEKAYKKYGHLIDEKGMINTDELQLQNTL